MSEAGQGPATTREGRKRLIAKARSHGITSALSAVFALVFLVEVVLLPPIANQQLAGVLDVLRKPIATVFASLIVIAFAYLQRHRPLAVLSVFLALTVAAAATPVTYYVVTTAPARHVLSESSTWPTRPLTKTAKGEAHNSPDALGRAKITWHNNDFHLALRSQTGTTQQGLYWKAGGPRSHYVFRARVDDHHGGTVVTCPLIFGIVDNRTYDTFRLQSDGQGRTIAVAYEIRPNGPALTTGFHGYTLDNTGPLPYVNTWNLVTPSERDESTLMIEADGDSYHFFVNNRLVFSREIPGRPNHQVAVGVTVLANNYPSEAFCDFHDVSLRVAKR